MNKRFTLLTLVLVLIMNLMVGCASDQGNPPEAPATTEPVVESSTAEPEKVEPKEIPTLAIGYMFSNHQTPLIVAAAKNEALKSEGVYLKEVLPKEKYILMSNEEEVANIDVVVAPNGGEVMTLMTQDHLQLGITSIGLPYTTIDQGHDMKVISPVHVDGISLVMGKDSPVNNYEDFVSFVGEKQEPVKIGYHSPANAPVILFEKATREDGLSVTENPEDLNADILLINLKGTGNLIPALLSGEVDGWIGPSPFPELALVEGTGKVILDLRDLPPEGKWHDFPCCVFSANTKTLEEHPEEVAKFYELLTIAANYANENKEETGTIVAEWMGVNEEAAKNVMTKFTTDANEAWLENAEVTFDSLKDTDKFSQNLKGKEFQDIKDDIFDLTYSEKVHK